MGTCNQNRKYLNAYMDGELAEHRKVMVDQHLAGCRACRTFLEELQNLAPVLQALDVPKMPEMLTARIMAKASLRRKNPLKKQAYSRWRELYRLRSWIVNGATVAALAIGLVMGGYMGGKMYPDSGRNAGMTRVMEGKSMEISFYGFDILSAAPVGSIEAVTLALLEN